MEITGILLDQDKPIPPRRLAELEADLRRNGFAYVMQTRNGKSHTILPFERPVAATVNGKAEREALIVSIGAAVGIEFDPAPARRNLGLVYSYRNVGSGPIVTTWAEGRGIPFEPTAGPIMTSTAPRVLRDPASSEVDTMSPDETIRTIVAKIGANRRPERAEIFRRFLAGEALGPHGQRDHAAQRLASWLAWFVGGRGDVEAILDLAVGTLNAHAADGSHVDERDLLNKLTRAMRDARRACAPEAKALEALLSSPMWRRIQHGQEP